MIDTLEITIEDADDSISISVETADYTAVQVDRDMVFLHPSIDMFVVERAN